MWQGQLMAIITITLIDLPDGTVRVCTDGSPPLVGQGLCHSQALAMELLGTAFKRRAEVVYDPHQVPAIALALELLDPEGLGFAVNKEIRDRARLALGRKAVEHRPTMAGVDIDRVHTTRAAS
jgi:hypothetical protein